jgi:hypothetical protein
VYIAKYSYITTKIKYVILPIESSRGQGITAYFAVRNGRVTTVSEVACRCRNGQKRSEISKHLDLCAYHELKHLSLHIMRFFVILTTKNECFPK